MELKNERFDTPRDPLWTQEEIDKMNKEHETQQMSDADINKYIEVNLKGLSLGARLQTRNLLNMLCQSGIDGKTKKQIRETIERAIMAAFDYGVNAFGEEMPIRTHGKLGKIESEYAQTLARLKEMGMLLMAKRMEQEQNKVKAEGVLNGEESKAEGQANQNETNLQVET